MIAAPIAAWLVRHLPARVLGVAAGSLIVLTNATTITGAVGGSGAVVTGVGLVAGGLGVAGVGWAVAQERRARAAGVAEPELVDA